MSAWRTIARKLGLSRGNETGLREAFEGIIERHRDELGTLSLGPDEIKMLFNILKNGDLRICDIMVPRVDVVAVDIEESFDAILKVFAQAAHSRLPLFRGSLDEVVGMVHVKDALTLLHGNGADEGPGQSRVADIQRPVLFVAPSMRAMDLLTKMRANRIHMAIIVDEYGGTDGLVTIEDLVEQIVGDIEDEHDTEEPVLIRSLGEGKFDADARLSLEDLEETIDIDLTDERWEDVDTVGGLVFSLAGRVPQIGERIKHESGVRFEVVDAEPRRILRLRIFTPKPAALRNA
ncbi:hemolysin C [Iodidimonas gelatinilytica]|uniref:Hemolysin C n=1 Tax=Iodidimonas gelatinilytica TaxID=1236966 RepID=A0A5A7MRC4_9PROT|nr:hemolysin family protein [Iodidimonas gelatinilytica]GEQ97429.1 hemolysin C [Iodidimonas gelatinilytica]GER02128.1 hemolysin C [Iodidimonas gelatinilytica]